VREPSKERKKGFRDIVDRNPKNRIENDDHQEIFVKSHKWESNAKRVINGKRESA